ncbi:MAG TPA: methyltransferase domain-containing protein [Flavobacterium sp.]|nr:methyltransferase domain-containing protein [Flavobacterium sp.]HPJ09363.1 methyltransferase domain-containing protein [Flavobacterium sp.]
MYNALKKIATKLIPRRFLFEHEEKLRGLYALFNSGNRFECNVCGKKLDHFVVNHRDDLLCPNCGSLQRNRRLWQLLQVEFLNPGMTVLDFSPSRCLYRRMKKIETIRYESTDLSGDFMADHQFDITQLAAADNTYDLIVCYHILEHIPNDRVAMQELLRVMKPGATALVQTPFKDGDIYENDGIVTDADRLKHFGQEDHVRVYSVNGLQQRLSAAGFIVDVRKYTTDENRYGLSTDETILILTKPKM